MLNSALSLLTPLWSYSILCLLAVIQIEPLWIVRAESWAVPFPPPWLCGGEKPSPLRVRALPGSLRGLAGVGETTLPGLGTSRVCPQFQWD